MTYSISRVLNCDFDTAVERLNKSLANEGFGIMTEIELDQVFKIKLGIDFKRYKIIGACNPTFAYEGLKKEEDLGLILPCKLAVQYISETESKILAVDANALFGVIDNPALNCVRDDISSKMELVINFA